MVRLNGRDVLAFILAAVLLFILVAIAIMAVLFIFQWAQQGAMPGLPGVNASENVQYQFGSVLPTWSGEGRVNVLLLGIDQRQGETGPWRTDTMMILSLDPVAKQGGVLSIPRDLWVPIPGYGENRINTAHFLGELNQPDGGGPALARQTVELNFGVPISYYVRINFDGFIQLVDLIGGVEICVEEPINDPTYPGPNYDYDPLYIEAGCQSFDGALALKYARTRHGSSDFDRARRQQEVMLAVFDKVTQFNILPTLAKNAQKIYGTIQTSLQTDLALDQMLALANTASQVKRADIRFGVIDQTCTQPWITPEGAQVLIPIRERIREVCDSVFTTVLPAPTPGAQVPATPEAATLSVLNGTTRAGLATATGAYLTEQGVAVIAMGNATRSDYALSLIVMNRPKPAAAARLAQLLGLPASAVVEGANPAAAADIEVILGADYAGPPQN